MELLNSASLIDTTMFVLGILSYIWAWNLRAILLGIAENGGTTPTNTQLQLDYLDQLNEIVSEDVIQFYFAVNFMCLVLKCQEFLEYHPEYGPL